MVKIKEYSEKILKMIFITNYKTTKVLKPCEEPFNLPAFLISPQYPTVLSHRFDSVSFMGSNKLNASFLGQAIIQRIAIICHIPDYLFRHVFQKTGIKSIFDQRYFMRTSTGCANGDRKTESVCDAHNLGSLALFGFTHTVAPFLAGANVPSIKPSLMSIPPRSFKSSASSVSILAKTSDLFHCWKYRWQMLFGGYRSGKSAHWAPVRRIQRMPLRTSRGSCGGLPDFPGCAFGLGMNFTIRCHCSFVISMKHISAQINPQIEVGG